MSFLPYNPDGETRKHRRHLPHWRQWGTTYFVTARLSDSLPEAVAKDWSLRREEWLRSHGLKSDHDLSSAPEGVRHAYHREFTTKFRDLIDAGHGECLLVRPQCVEVLLARLFDGHATAYHLDAWCVMPNHFHAIVEPKGRTTLGAILRHWKGGSARDINRELGRSGRLWQRESFDHIVRSDAQLEHFRRYIAANPAKARLKEGFKVGSGRGEKVVPGFSP